ncbi:hypothetical protein C2W59_01266 [Bacillus pumilus]|nr:hypothetical protein C2W59_01266 [Bacillus pumilus]
MIEKKEKNEKTMRRNVIIFSHLRFIARGTRSSFQSIVLCSPKDDEMV